MSEENTKKSALVPRLRFPQFREPWVLSPMSDLYSFRGNNSLSREKLNYTGGLFRNIHYGDIHTKFAQHLRANVDPVPYINEGESHSAIRPENYCMAGDMVFADASENMEDIGKAIEILDAGDIPLVCGLHTILARPNEGVFTLGFGAYLFSSEGVRRQIQREAQGAKVLGLSSARMGKVQLHYPRELDEQQKIADCLSSLDELIAAEVNKLDALKTHKKGLMQQLFPAEGETLPRLRFPEFREAGEWEVKPVGAICNVLNNKRKPIASAQRNAGIYPYYGASGIVDYVNDYIFDERLVLVGEDGAKWGPFEATAFIAEGKYWVNNHAHVLKPVSINDVLLQSYLTMIDLSPYVTGAAPPKLTLAKLKSIPIPFPETVEEQQKIADCLASLDDLIAAQTQKIELLKRHKKGLMQQLFPVLDEVRG